MLLERLEMLCRFIALQRGVEKGLSQGLSQGEECFAALTKELLNAGRTEDLLQAANDREYREMLYKEYKIEKEKQ